MDLDRDRYIALEQEIADLFNSEPYTESVDDFERSLIDYLNGTEQAFYDDEVTFVLSEFYKLCSKHETLDYWSLWEHLLVGSQVRGLAILGSLPANFEQKLLPHIDILRQGIFDLATVISTRTKISIQMDENENILDSYLSDLQENCVIAQNFLLENFKEVSFSSENEAVITKAAYEFWSYTLNQLIKEASQFFSDENILQDFKQVFTQKPTLMLFLTGDLKFIFG